jgi:hypothetical protein
MIITLTGHRDIEDELLLASRLVDELKPHLHREDLFARWGGAPGSDIIFAEVCLTLDIPIELYLPDPFYEKRYIRGTVWEDRFNQLAADAIGIDYAAQTNDWRNNFTRNTRMLTGADLVFAAYKYDDIDKFTKSYRPRKGGTSHGIQTALKLGFELGSTLIHIPV